MEVFMALLNLSAYKLAKDNNVPVSRIQEILKNRRRLSMDTALWLSHYFGASDEYFINPQIKINLESKKIAIKKEIESLPTYKKSLCS